MKTIKGSLIYVLFILDAVLQFPGLLLRFTVWRDLRQYTRWQLFKEDMRYLFVALPSYYAWGS